jgi:hypothetical protein
MHAGFPAKKGRLTLLCVGTGRDGTTSLSQMIQNMFDAEGAHRTAAHEWQSVELNDAFCLWAETGDQRYQQQMREIIEACPYDAIVGNGYQTILPLFAETYGEDLALVHLKRLDREACVNSLVTNTIRHPTNHRYYAMVPEASGRRTAAFHFGEMSFHDWAALSAHQRMEWYYDKTHALIEAGRPLFSKCYDLFTEQFADEASRRLLAEAASSVIVPKPVHVNRHFGFEEFDPEQRRWLQRVLGKLDIYRLAIDPAYGLLHFGDELARYLCDKVGLTSGASLDGAAAQLEASRAHARYLSAALDELARLLPGGGDEGAGPPGSEGRFFAERAELLQARNRAISDRDEAKAQQHRLEREVSERMIERDEAKAQLAELVARLQAIEGSKSWRLTAPFRRVLRTLVKS